MTETSNTDFNGKSFSPGDKVIWQHYFTTCEGVVRTVGIPKGAGDEYLVIEATKCPTKPSVVGSKGKVYSSYDGFKEVYKI